MNTLAAVALVVLTALAAPPRPSLAVLGFSAKEGVAANVGEILAENTATALRNSKRFSRVVSTADVVMLMSLEQQKQMLNCDSASCVAEIAGALGTDLVCAGTVAQVGSVVVLNVRIVEAGTGQTLASVGRTIQSAAKGGERDMGVVLLELPSVIRELLASTDDATLTRVALSGQRRAPPATAAPGASGTTPAPPPPAVPKQPGAPEPAPVAAPAPVATEPPGEEAARGPGPLRYALWGLGGAGGAASALVVLVGLAGVVSAVAMPVTSALVPGSHKVEGALQAGFLAALVVAGVALPTVVLGLGAAGAALLAGWVLA
jgi:TolB-like protein